MLLINRPFQKVSFYVYESNHRTVIVTLILVPRYKSDGGVQGLKQQSVDGCGWLVATSSHGHAWNGSQAKVGRQERVRMTNSFFSARFLKCPILFKKIRLVVIRSRHITQRVRNGLNISVEFHVTREAGWIFIRCYRSCDAW